MADDLLAADLHVGDKAVGSAQKTSFNDRNSQSPPESFSYKIADILAGDKGAVSCEGIAETQSQFSRGWWCGLQSWEWEGRLCLRTLISMSL